MKNKRLSHMFVLVMCCVFLFGIYFMISQLRNAAYAEIRNQTLTSIDVSDSNLVIKGYLHSTLGIVYDYSYTIEDTTAYLMILMKTRPFINIGEGGKSMFIEFNQPLPNNIEKICVKDNDNQIIIWDKSQGYASFDIQEKWRDEIEKIKKSNR